MTGQIMGVVKADFYKGYDKTSIEKNKVYTVNIEDMSDEGLGIGHIEGMAVFVKDTAPGDEAEVRIVKVKKNLCYGRLERIITPSSFRVEPFCPIAKQCGGCTLQHISYEKELEIKKHRVLNCLSRIGGIEEPEQYLEDVYGMKSPYHYRNKMQFPVGVRGDSSKHSDKSSDVEKKYKDSFSAFSCQTKTVLGFYAGRTHSLIPITSCKIGHGVNKAVISAVTKWADKCKISVYNEETGEGILRHVLTRVGFVTGELMVCIVVNTKNVPELDKLVAELSKEIDKYRAGGNNVKLKSVVMNINKERTNRILGDKTVLINGRDYITDYIGDVKFQISAQSFYQVNPKQTEKLYGKALEYAALTGEEIVWDMYSGIGTISLFLAQKAKKVYGVEVVAQAIDDAKINAEINDINNVEFFVGKAEEVVPLWMENRIGEYDSSSSKLHRGVDVVVVDPPRKGCDEKLLETIVKMAPKRMVYVSCDPATLSRDLKHLLAEGFKLEKFSVYDQFSRTMHCETVCLLSNIGAD